MITQFSLILLIIPTLHSGVYSSICTIVHEPLSALPLPCIIVQVPYTHSSSQRGLLHIYMMRLFCYHSYTKCETTQQVLFKCSYGISCMPLGVRYYVREDRRSLALLADPLMEYHPRFDILI
jgi:hypothetical protein